MQRAQSQQPHPSHGRSGTRIAPHHLHRVRGGDLDGIRNGLFGCGLCGDRDRAGFFGGGLCGDRSGLLPPTRPAASIGACS